MPELGLALRDIIEADSSLHDSLVLSTQRWVRLFFFQQLFGRMPMANAEELDRIRGVGSE